MHASFVSLRGSRVLRAGILSAVFLLVVLALSASEFSRRWFSADTESVALVGSASPPTFLYLPANPADLDLYAREAVLIDVDSNTILYSHGEGEVRSLASLTKLVTMYAILDLVENGDVSLDERVEPVPAAFWSAMPPRSSVLFLGVDQQVRIETLMLGLSIASGNDAATALAYHIDGSVPRFARRMETLLGDIGLESHSFSEPSGIEAANRATAADFARFVAHYLRRFPDAPARYHSVPSLTFPTADDYGNRWTPASIIHVNRNLLLRDYAYASGLKTGFTFSAGYNLAASAERDGRRIAAVILGVDAPNARIGSRRRTDDAITLFNHGFDSYVARTPRVPELQPVRVRGGENVEIVPQVIVPELLLPREDEAFLSSEVTVSRYVVAPVQEGQIIGEINYSVRGERVLTIPVFARDFVPAAAGPRAVVERFAARVGL